MSLTATIAEPTVTAEDFLEVLWGIRPGESRPRTCLVPTRYALSDEIAEWLYRLWGIGELAVRTG